MTFLLCIQYVRENRNLEMWLSGDYIIITIKSLWNKYSTRMIISNVLKQMLTDYKDILQHFNIQASFSF